MKISIAYDDLTPDIVRTMNDEDLKKLIKYAQKQAIEFRIVQDLIKDRNEMKYCYNKLYEQLQRLGVKPCIDYYTMGKTGRPKRTDKTPGNNSKDAKKRRKVNNKDV